jgi:hypothetical protein
MGMHMGTVAKSRVNPAPVSGPGPWGRWVWATVRDAGVNDCSMDGSR